MWVLAALALPLLAVGFVLWNRQQQTAPAALAAAESPEDTGYCRGTPPFTANPDIVGAERIGGSIAFATDRPDKGLILLTSAPGSTPFADSSWDDGGFLGSIAYDDAGNIYAAPTPRLSLQDNPLAGQATLWRVDAQTGKMAPYVALPGAANERNPFGILGLTYDCAHGRLFAGSVLGSTPSTEKGGVIGIDVGTRQQTTILSDMDVMGVLVVRVGEGYELYAGSARRPEVVAVTLDDQGNAVGEPRLLIDLTQAGATPSERARKLRLVGGKLVIDLVPFNYSFQSSASNVQQLRRATMAWASGAWIVAEPAADVGGQTK